MAQRCCVWTGGEWTKEIRIGPSASETEWVQTFTDIAGRPVRMEYPDGAFATMEYNDKGQRIRQTDPDGVTTLMAYDDRGRQTIQAIDLNANDTIDLVIDRITETEYEVATAYSTTVERTTTSLYPTASSSTPQSVAVNERSVDGLQQWQTRFGQTTHVQRSLPSGGDWTVTTTDPASVVTTQTFTHGRLTRVDYPNGGGMSYTHDPHGRVKTQVDDRTGTTTYTYSDRDQVLTVTAPPAQSGGSNLVTTNVYDDMARLTEVTLPDSTVQKTAYNTRGEVVTRWVLPTKLWS